MTRSVHASRGSAALARRLRELREDRAVTQRQLAAALGVQSVGTISAYESEHNPTTPPPRRLMSYATFFATHRSISNGRPRLLPDEELNDEERVARESLFAALHALAEPESESDPATQTQPNRLWKFPATEPVRIVCGHLATMTHPWADSRHQNYTELLTFADVDALIELHAYLSRVNPDTEVQYVRADRLAEIHELSSQHLVLLGGIGIADPIAWLVGLTDMPLRQVAGTDLVADGDVFAIGDELDQFLPTMNADLGLVEDVGLFARLRNPYNSARTLTVCSGVYSRGVLGAVRILGDDKLRDRNAAYLSARFADADQFAILMRVQVLLGNVMTPDLQNPNVRLWEWSDADGTGDAGDAAGR